MKKILLLIMALLLIGCQSAEISTVEDVKAFIEKEGELNLTEDKLSHLEKGPYTSGLEGYVYSLEDGDLYLSFMEGKPYYGFIEYPGDKTEILIDNR